MRPAFEVSIFLVTTALREESPLLSSVFSESKKVTIEYTLELISTQVSIEFCSFSQTVRKNEDFPIVPDDKRKPRLPRHTQVSIVRFLANSS